MKSSVCCLCTRNFSMADKNIGVILHVKNRFKLHGHSMSPIIDEEIVKSITYVRHNIQYIHPSDLSEKWRYPLISSMREKLQTEYDVSIRNIFVCIHTHLDDYSIYDKFINDYTRVFTIFIGSSVNFYTKNLLTKDLKKYTLEDGDLLFFDKDFIKNHNYSISVCKEKCISIVYFQ